MTEFALTAVRSLFPPEFWVDSIGTDIVRVLNSEGKSLMLLPVETALMILIEVGVMGTPVSHFSATSWDIGGTRCFGADTLAAVVGVKKA